MSRDPSTLPRHLEAEIHFLGPDQGGRSTPASSGYRPQFFYRNQDWDAQQYYPDVERVEPGTTVRTFLTFLSPELHVGHITVGMPFLVREGHKTVGYGRVLAIFDLDEAGRRSNAAGGHRGFEAPAT